MILESLLRQYERLEHDAETDIAPFGFSRQKIAFRVTLNPNGRLYQIEDLRRRQGDSLVPVSMIVPGGAKRAGEGINPNFLWDNTAYLLGYKPDDPKPNRTERAFAAFRDRHRTLEATIDDPDFSAVCRFLERWRPEKAERYRFLTELRSGFGVFGIRGSDRYIHELPRVRAYWQQRLGQDTEEPTIPGQCLVTGRIAPLARVHEPKIKGVVGAQTYGALIVSFGSDAFESYGKRQGFNAPVSEQAAFQYATALNHLLRAENQQRTQVGDATLVYWTQRATTWERLFGYILNGWMAEDEVLRTRANDLLQSISAGHCPQEFGDAETRLYVLGLSPNSSRLFVRFWHSSTVHDCVAGLHQHFRDLAMARSDRDPAFPSLRQILRELAREGQVAPPLLIAPLMRAVLTGRPYSAALYQAALRRIHVDRQVSYLRAAILKACLTRNARHRIEPGARELPIVLDPNYLEPAYHAGRLLAVLEMAQKAALPDLKETVTDRYLPTAMAMPAAVFSRLLQRSKHYLIKVRMPERFYHERCLQEIQLRIGGVPTHLDSRGQGLFAIGYYQQRHEFFRKKTGSGDE